MKTRHAKSSGTAKTTTIKAKKTTKVAPKKVGAKKKDLKAKENGVKKQPQQQQQPPAKTKAKLLAPKKAIVKLSKPQQQPPQTKSKTTTTNNNNKKVQQTNHGASNSTNNDNNSKKVVAKVTKTATTPTPAAADVKKSATTTTKPKISPASSKATKKLPTTKTTKAAVSKKLAGAKKNSIAGRRKSRVASLDASAKMKVLTEKVEKLVKKVEPQQSQQQAENKVPEVVVKVESKPTKSTPSSSNSSKLQKNNKQDKPLKHEKEEEQEKPTTSKTNKSTPKPATITKKLSKKIKKKKKPVKKRNELGEDRAEIIDTKVYKRLASLNATAIMAATSISATSVSGRKRPSDSDFDSEDSMILDGHSSIVKTVQPRLADDLQTAAPAAAAAAKTSSTINPQSTTSTTTKITKKSLKSAKQENGVKKTTLKTVSGSAFNPAKGLNAKTIEITSSSKSAFSPCSQIRKQPEVIEIIIDGPSTLQSGSSRTDGKSHVKMPGAKKIKVHTIYDNNIKKDEPTLSPRMNHTTSNFSGHGPIPNSNVPNSAFSRNPNHHTASASAPAAQQHPQPAQPQPQRPQPQQIPMMTPNYYPNIFSQSSSMPMSFPMNSNFGFPNTFPFPVMYTPIPFYNQPQQPALMSSPFFQRQHHQPVPTTMFGQCQPSPFVYQNNIEPSTQFRPSPFGHNLGQTPQVPRFGSSQMYPTMNNNAMHFSPTSGPSNTTSVTIEEIHDEAETEISNVVPIVVQAPSDDDRPVNMSSGCTITLSKKTTEKTSSKTKTPKATTNGSSSRFEQLTPNTISPPLFKSSQLTVTPVNGNLTTKQRPSTIASTLATTFAHSALLSAKKKTKHKPNVVQVILGSNHNIANVNNVANLPKNGTDKASPVISKKKDNPTNLAKKVFHGWSWEGHPSRREVFLNNDEKSIQKCYPAMRHVEGDIIHVGDTVLLKSGTRKNDLPFVAKIAALWETPSDEMQMSLLWYYRPEQVDAKAESFPSEIFASRHKDVNSVACIDDKCYVLTYSQYCRYRAQRKQLLSPMSYLTECVVPRNRHEELLPKHRRLPPLKTITPELVFCARKVYDYRSKRILKNPM